MLNRSVLAACTSALLRPQRRDSQPRVALIADALTRECLDHECEVLDLTPANYRFVLSMLKPDLLFVESAWQGYRNSWRYRVAAYPDRPERNNDALAQVVAYARDRDIPCVFWNKEDGVHFERFIASAALFEHIFTVDENCLPRYRAVVEPHVTVDTLMFAVQPAVHRASGKPPRHARACFMGSFSHHVHPGRRELQLMLFEAASTELGLTVFDRNSDRRSDNYRYPTHIPIEVRPAVPHAATARIYQDYLVSLNVNTVVDSPTMFSRRLIEILGCGGLAVSTPALAVERLFASYCHVVGDAKQTRDLFARLGKHGLSQADRRMTEAGAAYVTTHHTWAHRMRQIMATAGL